MQIPLLTLAILVELSLLLLLTSLALIWYVRRQRNLLRNQQAQLAILHSASPATAPAPTTAAGTALPSSASDHELSQCQAELLALQERYHTLETQWHKSYADAQQLLLQQSQHNQEHWQTQLLVYQREHQQLAKQLQQAQAPHSIKLTYGAAQTNEESLRLRNQATDHYRQIHQLQQQLKDAQTLQEKAQLAGALAQQLQHQVRLLQEADTCIQLLENELDQAHQELAKATAKPL